MCQLSKTVYQSFLLLFLSMWCLRKLRDHANFHQHQEQSPGIFTGPFNKYSFTQATPQEAYLMKEQPDMPHT